MNRLFDIQLLHYHHNRYPGLTVLRTWCQLQYLPLYERDNKAKIVENETLILVEDQQRDRIILGSNLIRLI